MIDLLAIAIGAGFLLADRYMPLWIGAKRGQVSSSNPGLLERLFGGTLKTDP